MFVSWLESLPTSAAGIIVVGGVVLFSLLLGYAVARFTSNTVRAAHNDRAGFIIAVIGVIYAVLLAFVAIGVWDRFDRAEDRSFEEAGSLAIVYRDAGSFRSGEVLRATLRAYAEAVIDQEWPRMHRGAPVPLSSPLLEQADRHVRDLPVDNSPRLADIQAQMLSAMDTALHDREARLTIDQTGISRIMWATLIVGGIVTIAFTYLFGFEQPLMQQLMIGALSFLIALVLFLIIALDYPFRGGIAVGPEAFRALQETFKAIGP
jgi:hypothetical protein